MMFVQTSSEILNAMDSNSLSSGLVVTDACGAKHGKFLLYDTCPFSICFMGNIIKV